MTDAEVFRLPDLGEGLAEAEIVTWHVSPGDRVVAGQPLLAVETDKAVVEIPAPQAGTVARLHAAVGDRLPVGAALVTFGAAAAVSAGVVGSLVEAAAPPDELPASAHTTGAGPTTGATPAAGVPRAPATATPAIPGVGAGPNPAPTRVIQAAPAVRQLARELGVDLAMVTGSGPGGAIRSSDLRDAASGARVRPVRGARRAMAERMADAHARVVPATVTDEADIHAWNPETGPLPRLIRAVAVAARAVPRLNAAFDDTRWELRDNPTVDLGIAMETDDGLFVPVLRDVGGREADAIAAEVAELEAAVRARTILPARLRGQTISLSNFGAVAGRHASMVVVPPQVAIVGAGRAAPRVVADGERAVVHRVLPLSLTIDHRVITGVEACRFLAVLVADLELSQ